MPWGLKCNFTYVKQWSIVVNRSNKWKLRVTYTLPTPLFSLTHVSFKSPMKQKPEDLLKEIEIKKNLFTTSWLVKTLFLSLTISFICIVWQVINLKSMYATQNQELAYKCIATIKLKRIEHMRLMQSSKSHWSAKTQLSKTKELLHRKGRGVACC